MVESACNAGDLVLISGLERSAGDWNGNPLQYSSLENSMDRPWGRKESDTTEQLILSYDHYYCQILTGKNVLPSINRFTI